MDCITQKKKLAIYALLLSTLISRKESELNVENQDLTFTYRTTFGLS